MDERPITRWHRGHARPLEARDGAETPRRYGPVDAEVDALLEGAALVDLSAEARMAVTGRHRARFLHAMTTCQVKALEPGQGNYGLAVDRGGKLRGQFWLECEADRLVMSAPAPWLESLRAHFEAHRVADDVKFEPLAPVSTLALIGPRSEAALSAALGEPVGLDAPYAFRDTEIAGIPVRVRRNDQRLLTPGYDLVVAPDEAVALFEALVAAGATPAGSEAFDVVRVGRGVPRDGLDMGEANIPLESQVLYDTMDWDKGCYIGQEVIAMMHYRGRPNRHLVALRLADDAPLPSVGDEVLAEDGRAVGVVGSAASHPRLGGPVALAVIKRKYTEGGAALALSDARRVTVAPLPLFAAP
ncbi:MAG: aminomethyl transferase family protein [Deltaproteobacteria bacterium]|nr:aminomethyl transferase family protein [Deltaproteobacteria bacterium]